MRNVLTSKVLFGLALAAGLALGGCDDEEGGATVDVNAKVNATAATVNAVKGQEFTFAMGIPSIMGATGSTSVTFTAANAATIKRMNMMGNAMVAYGSCTFTVPMGGAAGIPAGSYTVNPCTINVNAMGVPVGGAEVTGTITLTLGNSTSMTRMVMISVAANGQVSINGQVIPGLVLTGTGM